MVGCDDGNDEVLLCLEMKDGGDLTALVLYHYPCPDGISGALAAHLYHKAIGAKVRYVPHTVYDSLMWSELLPLLDGVDVIYLIDFSGPCGFAETLARKAAPKAVVILDHHKSGADKLLRPDRDLIDNLFPIFDMNRSGATIAYDYFWQKLLVRARNSCVLSGRNHQDNQEEAEDNEREAGGKKESSDCGMAELREAQSCQLKDKMAMHLMANMKTFFTYIEDADLYRWRLPDSKAFSAGLGDLALEYDARSNPKIFDQLLSLGIAELMKKGSSLLAEREVIMEALVKHAFEIEVRTNGGGGGEGAGRGVKVFGKFLACRADGQAHLRSRLGNLLALESRERGLQAVGAVVYIEPGMKDETKVKVSLRSLEDDEDTTEISAAFGGGGHAKASAFIVDRDLFESWRV